MELDKLEKEKLYSYFEIPRDIPLSFENLFKYAVSKLEPSYRFPIGKFRHSDWLKVEFIYHGAGNYLDCYIRFSDTDKYCGGGCGLHWRPYENIHLALARALLQAIDVVRADGDKL